MNRDLRKEVAQRLQYAYLIKYVGVRTKYDF